MRKGETTISIPYFGCKQKGCRIKCGWKHKKISIPYWYPDWKDTLKWDQSDWIAFAGGKGTYSSYEYAQPNQKIKLTAHHGDSGYLVWALEHGKNHKTNNEFKLNKNADITPNATPQTPYETYQSLEKKYNGKPTDFGIELWK